MSSVTASQDLGVNKRAVLAFFDAFNAQDWGRLSGLLTDDFHWVIKANERHQSAGLAEAPSPGKVSDKAEMLGIYQQTIEYCLDGKFELGFTTVTAEDDRVAVESWSHAVSVLTHREYTNLYHHLFVLSGGRIRELREYQDTLHAYDVWMAP